MAAFGSARVFATCLGALGTVITVSGPTTPLLIAPPRAAIVPRPPNLPAPPAWEAANRKSRRREAALRRMK